MGGEKVGQPDGRNPSIYFYFLVFLCPQIPFTLFLFVLILVVKYGHRWELGNDVARRDGFLAPRCENYFPDPPVHHPSSQLDRNQARRAIE